MATHAAHKRLTREYQVLQKSPPEYITAAPSESNILEWHYILTGPPATPYHNGQYWGTLTFPNDYPFAPPAIRMHTPSGRFRCSERLCLSISDFHPKSFNPSWGISTILLGVLSFMTSEEMTTGSISGSEAERRAYAARSRWWNSTGGGSSAPTTASSNSRGFGGIKGGDGGRRFREQFPDLDRENWKWMEENHIDAATGRPRVGAAAPATAEKSSCSPELDGMRKRAGTAGLMQAVGGGREAANAGQGWFRRNRIYVIGGALFLYVIAARVLKDQQT